MAPGDPEENVGGGQEGGKVSLLAGLLGQSLENQKRMSDGCYLSPILLSQASL